MLGVGGAVEPVADAHRPAAVLTAAAAAAPPGGCRGSAATRVRPPAGGSAREVTAAPWHGRAPRAALSARRLVYLRIPNTKQNFVSGERRGALRPLVAAAARRARGPKATRQCIGHWYFYLAGAIPMPWRVVSVVITTCMSTPPFTRVPCSTPSTDRRTHPLPGPPDAGGGWTLADRADGGGG